MSTYADEAPEAALEAAEEAADRLENYEFSLTDIRGKRGLLTQKRRLPGFRKQTTKRMLAGRTGRWRQRWRPKRRRSWQRYEKKR
jgi:hypothetical protein